MPAWTDDAIASSGLRARDQQQHRRLPSPPPGEGQLCNVTHDIDYVLQLISTAHQKESS